MVLFFKACAFLAACVGAYNGLVLEEWSKATYFLILAVILKDN